MLLRNMFKKLARLVLHCTIVCEMHKWLSYWLKSGLLLFMRNLLKVHTGFMSKDKNWWILHVNFSYCNFFFYLLFVSLLTVLFLLQILYCVPFHTLYKLFLLIFWSIYLAFSCLNDKCDILKLLFVLLLRGLQENFVAVKGDPKKKKNRLWFISPDWCNMTKCVPTVS